MITAKQLKDTYPHRQMRMYIEDLHVGKPASYRAAMLGALVKKFLFNFNNEPNAPHWKNFDQVPDNVEIAFLWLNTPEGQDFWERVNDFVPEVAAVPQPNPWAMAFKGLVGKPVKIKLPKAAKAAPKKRVGWWA